MIAGDHSLIDYWASLHERPFEGGAATPVLDLEEQGLVFTAYLLPELADWKPLLKRLRVTIDRAASIAEAARRNGTDFQSELLMSQTVGEDKFYRALAAELGIPYAADVGAERLIFGEQDALAYLRRDAWHIPVKLAERDGSTSCVIAPERMSLYSLRLLVSDRPKVQMRLRMTRPAALRAALIARVRPRLAQLAEADLFDRHPSLSARIVATFRQGSVIGAAATALAFGLAFATGATWFMLHIAFTAFFMFCVGLRLFAMMRPPTRPRKPVVPEGFQELPVYSVLVALYKEAEIIPELVAALDRLVWPKSKLEIKLVCEEDDTATLDALKSLRLPATFEVIKVPVQGPRTKPKALCYALPLAGGEFVVLYDAEDHPDPLQLIEAWQAFAAAGPKLACVQAPLEISNGADSWVARLFAFEYAALFRGLLPWLADRRLVLPLGGTSNHFRRAILEKVGGWDPHNVTEDADLGIRLARFGYETATIASPTYEAAPTLVRIWVPQRTRWFKGWLQTWLVHMRHPTMLARDLGLKSFVGAQILLSGMVVSSLFHPLLVLTALWLTLDLLEDRAMSEVRFTLLIADSVNILLGYLSFLVLGWRALNRAERGQFWRVVVMTPAYWFMMSYAAWRAVYHLWAKPHHWEKTPHGAAQVG